MNIKKDTINRFVNETGLNIYIGYRDMSNEIKLIEDKLNELGIEYRNEFSEAGYVYRFVISKKSVNLQKIK